MPSSMDFLDCLCIPMFVQIHQASTKLGALPLLDSREPGLWKIDKGLSAGAA